MSADEVFTMADIEKAAQAMYGPDLQQQQIGADYLMRWQSNRNSPEQALELLAKSQVPIAKIIAANCLYEVFKGNYATLPVAFRKQWRLTLIEHLRGNTANGPLALKLTQILVLMALFDWPDNWPDFPFDIYPEGVSVLGYGNTMVFDDLIVQATSSPNISWERRNSLLDSITQLAPTILETALHGLGDSGKVLTAVSILRHMRSFCPIEMLLKDEVIALITSSFREFDTIHCQALELAYDLFIDREDAVKHFSMFGTRLLVAKSEIAQPSVQLASFFIQFLRCYLVSFEVVTNVQLLSLVQNEVIQSFKWELCDMNLRWDFWNSVIADAKNGVAFVQMLMKDLWPQIIASYASFFEIERCRRRGRCFGTWCELVALIPEVVVEYFTRYDSFDTTLCFAAGCTVKLLPIEMGRAIAERFFDMGITQLEMSPDSLLFRRSLVFATTIFLDLIEPSAERVGIVQANIRKCLESKDDCLIDGVVELLNRAETFLKWDESVTHFLLVNMSLFLDRPRGYIAYRDFNRLDIEAAAELALPMVLRLIDFGESAETGHPDFALVNFVLVCLKYAKASVMECLWPALVQLCARLTSNEHCIKDTLGLLVSVIQHGFEICAFDKIEAYVQPFIEQFSSKPELEDELYQLIAAVRSIHPETEPLWPRVMEIVSVRVNVTMPVPSSFFDMLSKFDGCPLAMSCSSLMKRAMFGLAHLDPSMNAAALSFLKSLVTKMNQDQAGYFAENFRSDIVTTLFQSLTDMLHGAATSDSAVLLMLLVQIYQGDPSFEEEFVDDVTSTTAVTVRGIAGKLFTALKSAAPEDIDRIISDFLATVRCSTVGIQDLAFRTESNARTCQSSESDGDVDILIDQMSI